MGNTQKMERQIYATDGEYFLYPITEEDHEDFVNLQIQTQGNTTLFLNPHFKDIIWNQVLQGKDKTFSIFNKQGDYCGSTELQHLPSKTPEIGIALIEEYRNKGLAKKVMKMLVKQTCHEQEVDYFLIRISSRNARPKHVFEKMGAIFIREETSFFTTFMNEYKKLIDKYDVLREKDQIIKRCHDFLEEEEIIFHYIILPELFL